LNHIFEGRPLPLAKGCKRSLDRLARSKGAEPGVGGWKAKKKVLNGEQFDLLAVDLPSL